MIFAGFLSGRRWYLNLGYPNGDNEWHLFNIVTDPGETTDLKEQMPDRFEKMLSAYGRYVADNKVLPIPEDYTKNGALKDYAMGIQMKSLKAKAPKIAAIGIVLLGLIGFFIVRRRH